MFMFKTFLIVALRYVCMFSDLLLKKQNVSKLESMVLFLSLEIFLAFVKKQTNHFFHFGLITENPILAGLWVKMSQL